MLQAFAAHGSAVELAPVPPYSYGLYSYGLHRHGLYSYGPYSYGLYSHCHMVVAYIALA